MKPKDKFENALAKIAGSADAKSGKVQSRVLYWLEQISKKLGTYINPGENVIDIFIRQKNGGDGFYLIAPGPTTYEELKKKIGDTPITNVFANVYMMREFGAVRYDLVAERATVETASHMYKIFGGSYNCSGSPVVPTFKSVQIQISGTPGAAANITVNNFTVSTSN